VNGTRSPAMRQLPGQKGTRAYPERIARKRTVAQTRSPYPRMVSRTLSRIHRCAGSR
jgi:hypothetical protein